jgi:hypothetical protein
MAAMVMEVGDEEEEDVEMGDAVASESSEEEDSDDE